MRADRNIILECRQLTRCVGGQALLSDVDFQVIAGTTTALFGPSGAGKSILLRALAFLDPIQSGSIEWQGKRLTPSTIPIFRSQFMYVQQKSALLEGTVLSALHAPFLFSSHRNKEFNLQHVKQLLSQFGRGIDFLEKPTAELSGGEAQLASLARAMLLDPVVLLLDEPTSALDADTELQVEESVKRWLSSERAIVIVSHKPSQIRRVADRIVTLRAGRVESIKLASEWDRT